MLTLLAELETLELLVPELVLLLTEFDEASLEFAAEFGDEFCDGLLLSVMIAKVFKLQKVIKNTLNNTQKWNLKKIVWLFFIFNRALLC